MTEDVIERYDTVNTKRYPYELLFGDFHDQPIPPQYYGFLNDNNDYDNTITETPVGDVFLDKNEWKMQSCQMHLMLILRMKTLTNYKFINDYGSINSDIEPLQDKIL